MGDDHLEDRDQVLLLAAGASGVDSLRVFMHVYVCIVTQLHDDNGSTASGRWYAKCAIVSSWSLAAAPEPHSAEHAL